MIERVARAICAADGETWPTDWDASEDAKIIGLRHRLELGRAAIAAMREPTAEMRNAVRPYLADERGNPVDDEWCDRLIEEIIDAALK